MEKRKTRKKGTGKGRTIENEGESKRKKEGREKREGGGGREGKRAIKLNYSAQERDRRVAQILEALLAQGIVLGAY